jgi:hypothetical protein
MTLGFRVVGCSLLGMSLCIVAFAGPKTAYKSGRNTNRYSGQTTSSSSSAPPTTMTTSSSRGSAQGSNVVPATPVDGGDPIVAEEDEFEVVESPYQVVIKKLGKSEQLTEEEEVLLFSPEFPSKLSSALVPVFSSVLNSSNWAGIEARLVKMSILLQSCQNIFAEVRAKVFSDISIHAFEHELNEVGSCQLAHAEILKSPGYLATEAGLRSLGLPMSQLPEPRRIGRSEKPQIKEDPAKTTDPVVEVKSMDLSLLQQMVFRAQATALAAVIVNPDDFVASFNTQIRYVQKTGETKKAQASLVRLKDTLIEITSGSAQTLASKMIASDDEETEEDFVKVKVDSAENPFAAMFLNVMRSIGHNEGGGSATAGGARRK